MFVPIFITAIVVLLQWISANYDPTECENLMVKSRQWDGDVSEAIQKKAKEITNKAIHQASWGLFDKPRGGECSLKFEDVQGVLTIVLILWLINKFRSRNKCAFWWQSCRKTRSRVKMKTPPTSPRQKTKQTKQSSSVRCRKTPMVKSTKQHSQTPLRLDPTVVQELSTHGHGNALQAV
jgi:hypothetical protein